MIKRESVQAAFGDMTEVAQDSGVFWKTWIGPNDSVGIKGNFYTDFGRCYGALGLPSSSHGCKVDPGHLNDPS